MTQRGADSTVLNPNYEYSGGPVRRGVAFYVKRDADKLFQDALENKRDVLVITAPRQMGKTSLCVNVLGHLDKMGFKTGIVDFRASFGQPEEMTRSAKGWNETLMRAVARSLKLDPTEVRNWTKSSADLTTTELIIRFFTEFIRVRLHGPIVVAFDEIDLVQLYHYFTDIFFEAIRALAADRDALDMSFVLIGLNHPRNLLKSAPPGGFNISGLHISLDDFDPQYPPAIEAWAQDYPADSKADRVEIARTILSATGGQPFLTTWLFEQARRNSVSTPADIAPLVEALINDARNGEGVASHFESPRDIILSRPNLAFRILDTVEKARIAPVPMAELRGDVVAALVSTGLVRERSRAFVIKSPIYEAFFDEDWILNLKKSVGGRAVAEHEFSVDLDPNSKKRVCIISTGGMISMEPGPDGKIAAPHDLGAFFRRFPELFSIADFDVVPLMSKDSSNMNPEDWALIAEAIYQRRDDYRGFVVTHGTDTLPHTASAVAYALGEGLSFPVVFVGSQTAPHVIHGDARINLMRACTVATREDIPEVVAVVGDYIHRAVRVQKKDDYRFEGMHSPTFEPIGIIADRIEIKATAVRKPAKKREIDLQNEFSHNVFKVGLYPGLDPRFLMPVLRDPGLEGVIIETLGIGNVPVEGKWSLIPFIEEATHANVPVLLASQFPIQPEMTTKYEPASAPLAAGAIGAANMAPPAAVTKFMWVLPQVRRRIESGRVRADRKLEEVAKLMNLDEVGELGQLEDPIEYTKPMRTTR